ncbi:MAG: DUF1512 domain-containing protein [Candidatus Micrarchaeota archaeon]|nr:DUF1512 domain-containing protein [Candidatus Micrarchaeota archaeon]
MISQFGSGDWLSTLIWFIIFLIFIIFGPRLMVSQTVWRLERDLADLEAMAEKSRRIIFRSLRAGKETRRKILSFMDFFVVPPVDLDPYGVVKKLSHLLRHSDERFKTFVSEITPGMDDTGRKNLKNAIASAITVHQLTKIVRHFLEMVKKYKIFQLAFLLQMQLPIIKRIASSSVTATDAFLKGIPIGDSIGPLVVAGFMKNPKTDRETEMAYSVEKIGNRKVVFAKADGPGAGVGYPGKFVEKFVSKHRVSRIITVDAAGKLEGEKTGSIAEGVGVAMGGPGVDRYEIEEIATKKNIPLDAVVIKQNPQEDVLVPMRKEIYRSLHEARKLVLDAIERAPKNSTVLVIGVGNTSGVGNDEKSAARAESVIRKNFRKKPVKKRKWF